VLQSQAFVQLVLALVARGVIVRETNCLVRVMILDESLLCLVSTFCYVFMLTIYFSTCFLIAILLYA
jgi:hypothetical protein